MNTVTTIWTLGNAENITTRCSLLGLLKVLRSTQLLVQTFKAHAAALTSKALHFVNVCYLWISCDSLHLSLPNQSGYFGRGMRTGVTL